jgi:hypothetical protein
MTMYLDLNFFLILSLSSLACLVIVTSELQLNFFSHIFCQPFKFVKYINKCTKNILKQVTFGINQ